MRAKTIAAFLALAAVVAVSLPGGAVAKPGFYKVPGSTFESIQMHATNGYRLSLYVANRRAEVSLFKSTGFGSGDGGVSSVTYERYRRLPVGPDLHFRLGREVDVDLHFVPGPIKEHVYAGCVGGPEVTEKGRFVGTIRYRGRQDLSRVDAHRVRGNVTRTSPRTCRVEKAPSGVESVGISTSSSSAPTVPAGALELIAGTSDSSLNFLGLRFEDPQTPSPVHQTFDAWIERREPGFTVSSLALAGGAKNSFVSPEPDKPLSGAEVSPSAPFSGSATFEMTSRRQGEWSGDLAIELPGYGRVPLTGQRFAAGLCETRACTPTLPKSLRPRTSGDGAAGAFKVSYFNGG